MGYVRGSRPLSWRDEVDAAAILSYMGEMENTGGYRGTLMHPSLGGRTAAGSLSVVAGELHFDGSDVHVQMPISGIRVEAGGLNNEHFLLQHPTQPGWVLSTADHRVLDELGAAGGADLLPQLTGARRSKVAFTRLYIAGGVLVLFVVGVILLLFLLKSTLARAVADRLPVAWEEQFGNAAMDSVRKQMKIIEDPKWEAQLNVIRSKLLPGITNSRYPIQIHVADAAELNAFAMPGGHIVVFTGLLKGVERPEELAGVLAHEIAHITERHVLRKMIESLGLVLVLQALFGDTSGLAAVASQGSELLLQQKFSRDFEREADDVGFQYLLNAKINPKGMVDFFVRLEKDAQKSGAPQLTLLATHPPTTERIKRLEAKLTDLDERSFLPLPSAE